MTIPKPDWGSIWTSITSSAKGHKAIWLSAAGLVLLAIVLMFASDRISTAIAEHKKAKLLANIQAGTKEVANIQSQIADQKGDVKVLEAQRDDLKNGIAQDTQELANISQAREEDKVATNQALTNFNAAMQTNSNHAVNVTAEDLENIASRLP